MHSFTEITAENGLVDWKAASALFDKVDGIASMGRAEQLQQGGSLLFLDEARLFIDGKPSANLQEAINQLREHGVDVVILTTNNPDRLEDTADIRNQMTLDNGLGSYGDGTLAPRAIVCIFNTHTTDPEYPREVVCATGSSLEAPIDDEKAVDLIIDGVLAGSPDAGFTNAYNNFDSELDAAKRELSIRATQQAMPQPTLAPPSHEEASQSPVLVQPSHPEVSFYDAHKKEVNLTISAVVLMALVGADQMLAKPQRIFVKNAEKSRGLANNKYRELSSQHGLGLSFFDAIASSYGESYPDKEAAEKVLKGEFSEQMAQVDEANAELMAAKINFLQKKAKMALVVEMAEKLKLSAGKLIRLVTEKGREAEDLSKRADAAQENVDAVRMRLREENSVEDWYDQKKEVFKNVLPSRKHALNTINTIYESAFNDAYLNVEFALRGSDTAVELMDIIDKFMEAVEAFTHSYEVSFALYSESGKELSKWPVLAIKMPQLANSGTQLLNEAKAGISAPDKLDQVIELSLQAETEFASAKNFASASATVFELHDENNKQIAFIEEEGGFKDSHIKEFREQIATNLSEANLLASQGKWKEAQEKLGIMMAKTDESLSEMKRLEQLHQQNINDLDNLAKEVEKDKDRYGGETTTAWNDLQQNFVSANYDEKNIIWQELRSESGEHVVISDLNPHYEAIALTLKELTDDPIDQSDIATRATSRNSMEEQKFDDAAALIRQMEKRLADSRRMMDELSERQKLANKSKNEYEGAIENSQSRLELARLSIDDFNTEDRFVDEEVDRQIADAEKFVDLAVRAGEASVYIAALEAANRATDLAIRARQNAEEQIKALQQLFSQLETDKKQSNLEARKSIKAVIDEKDAVITSNTLNLQRTIEQALLAVVTAESGLAPKEDHELEAGIRELLEDFTSIDRQAEELDRSFEADKRSYQKLLDKLDESIEEAETAISSARTKCNKPDAGSAGDFSLSSAVSSKPSMADWGAKRSIIKSRIESAEQSKQYADNAYAQARKAIKKAEEAREAERQRKLALERKRQKDRQDAIDRANDRANEARKSIQRNQSQARRKF